MVFAMFTYVPLTRPEPGDAAESIRCEVRNYCVNDAPPYEALSYCWGDLKEKSQIECDKFTLKVTENVLTALMHLRLVDKPRLLWIDQICIDQHNLQERSYQVSIMRIIYHRAARTLIWLGKSDDRTQMAFEAVHRLSQVHANLEASGVAYTRLPDSDHILEQYGLPSQVGRDPKITAMMNLLRQPWFERVWIIQETVVSRSVLLTQGTFSVPWEPFATAIVLIWSLRMNTFTSYHIDKNIKVVHFLQTYRQLFHAGKVPQLRRSLELFRDSKATDPRDKVYAVIGLSEAYKVTDPSLYSYTQSISDSYRLWTIWMLRKENSLEVLGGVNRYKPSGVAQTYSWVPDWNTTDENTAHHSTPLPSESFKASASSQLTLRFRDDDKVLGLSGYHFDTIEAVGDIMTMSPTARIFGFVFLAHFHAVHQIWRSWEAIAQVRTRRIYTPTDETMWDTYWQTLLFGESGYRPSEKEQVKTEFNDFYDTQRKRFLPAEWILLYRFKHLWAIYCVILLLMTGLGAFGKYKSGKGLKFTVRCSQAGWRRMIRTTNGYLGLAVHAAQVGDKLALFQGEAAVRGEADGRGACRVAAGGRLLRAWRYAWRDVGGRQM